MLKVIKENSWEYVSMILCIIEHISTKTQTLNCKGMVKYIPLKLKLFVKNKTLHNVEGQHIAYEGTFKDDLQKLSLPEIEKWWQKQFEHHHPRENKH